MCHKTPNPMKNAAKRLLKSLSPLVFKTFYTLSWSTVQGEIFLKFYLEVDIKVNWYLFYIGNYLNVFPNVISMSSFVRICAFSIF